MKFKCKHCGWTKENEPMMHITDGMLKEISAHEKTHRDKKWYRVKEDVTHLRKCGRNQ